MRSTYEKNSDNRAFLLPATLMLSAILMALWTLGPRTAAKIFAGERGKITIEASQGEFGFTLAADESALPTVKIGSTEIIAGTDGIYHIVVSEDIGSVVLSCDGGSITQLIFTEGADEVVKIDGSYSGLKEIDVSNCPNLESLDLSDTALETLVLNNSAKLTQLNLENAGVRYDSIQNFVSCSEIADISAITLESPEVKIINGNPSFEKFATTVDYLLCGYNDDETKFFTAAQSDAYDSFFYEDLFDADASIENITLHCKVTSEDAPFVRYLFDVTIDNPDYDPLAVPKEPVAINNDGSSVIMIAKDITGIGKDTASTTLESPITSLASNSDTEADGSESEEENNKDDDTSSTTTTTTTASNSTTTTTKSGTTSTNSSNVISASDTVTASIIRSVSVNNATFTVNNKTVDKKNVRVKAVTTSDTTTLSAIRTAKGLTDSNSIGYDISLIDITSNSKVTVASGSITVVVDYPSSTVKANKDNYTFMVYHHVGNNGTSISVESLKGTPTSEGISFTTSSFSLFVPSWATSSGSDDGKGDDGKGPETGEDDLMINLSLLLAAFSVTSFATIVLKRKYTNIQG